MFCIYGMGKKRLEYKVVCQIEYIFSTTSNTVLRHKYLSLLNGVSWLIFEECLMFEMFMLHMKGNVILVLFLFHSEYKYLWNYNIHHGAFHDTTIKNQKSKAIIKHIHSVVFIPPTHPHIFAKESIHIWESIKKHFQFGCCWWVWNSR